MNKQQFIEIFLQKADFFNSDELEAAGEYLEKHLNDGEDCGDAEAFAKNVKLSFELFKHLNEVEAQRQISDIALSVSKIMGTASATESDTDKNEESREEISADKNESETPEEEVQAKSPAKKGGLIEKIKEKKGFNKVISIFAVIFALILLLPILFLIGSIFVSMYVIPVSVILAIWLVILAVLAAFAMLGTIAVSYGIANLFITPPIGLMEIGLGTVLFAIMLAIWALNYQFITSSIPFFCKMITRFIKAMLRYPKEFIFGKEEC